MAHINFEAKSDRELLVLNVQNTNLLLEEKIPEMKKDIACLQEECKRRGEICPGYIPRQPLFSSRKTYTAGVGTGGGLLIAIYAVVKAICAHYGIVI